MRTASLAFVSLLFSLQPVLGAETGSTPAVGDSKTFGDWTVGCDNLRACTAIGLVADGAEELAYVKVLRDGSAAAAPTVSVIYLTSGDENEAALDLALSGKETRLPVGRLQASGLNGYLSATIDPETADAFLGALVKGDALSVRENGQGKPTLVSLRGMSAALRFMDAEQGRDGGVTALVARGDKPAAAVSPPPAPPPLRVLKLTAIDPAPPLPKGISATGEDCDGKAEPEAYETGDGRRIFGVICYSAAYNVGVEYWLSDEKGVRRLSFRTGPEAGPSDFDGLVNAGLNEHGLTLIEFDRARGIGDCGTTSSWGFDGEAFQLVGLASMGECRGVRAEDWPVLYTRAIEPRADGEPDMPGTRSQP